MSILHMNTEFVRGVGVQLQQASNSLLHHTQQLNGSVQALSNAWQGPSADIFANEIRPILQRLNQTTLGGDTLNQRLQREVDEWELASSHFGGTPTNTGITIGTEVNYVNTTDMVRSNPNPATPELVKAILEDEANRRDFWDVLGDVEAWFIDKYEGRLESAKRYLLEKIIGQPIERISLGKAQMNPEVVMELVDKGYLPKPNGWENDKLDISLRWLLNDDKASELVSARINHIVDHWAEQGQDISDRPEIIATLYSIGLEGKQGVNPDPQPNERGQSIADRADELKATPL